MIAEVVADEDHRHIEAKDFRVFQSIIAEDGFPCVWGFVFWSNGH